MSISKNTFNNAMFKWFELYSHWVPLTLFEQWCGFFYVPQESDKCKCCETGPTVFRP